MVKVISLGLGGGFKDLNLGLGERLVILWHFCK